MSLINCHECNHQVSTEAKSCPSCGAKVKKPVGIAGWILAIIVVAFVAKCSSMSNDAKQAAAIAELSKTPEQKALETKEKAESEARHLSAVVAMTSIKKALRDPASVEWSSVLTNKDGTTICIEYRAKNGFGGYAKEFASFVNGKPSKNLDQWNKHCAGKKMFDNKHSRLAIQ